jgi:preprotein translocase subunit SecD
VAIVLDGNVTSAPTITQAGGIAGGQAQITGGFTQSSATQLADILKYGSLPLRFTAPSIQSISPTLGSQQLRGGLIAGAIGLGLVIIFSLLYYRALGLVTVGSLAVSGLILYAVTTLLGHSSVGYTLSLPGIAGFIVAVGITADSFVVFFERLRDEIREGRRLRSAVDRAWPRARRTIISADFISLLAAFILYVVSIGDVRGFAFTLGLSTLSDLFIVFFFTKPLLMVLAKRPAFDSGATWTGIGKARAGVVREPEPDRPTARRTPRAKEA